MKIILTNKNSTRAQFTGKYFRIICEIDETGTITLSSSQLSVQDMRSSSLPKIDVLLDYFPGTGYTIPANLLVTALITA